MSRGAATARIAAGRGTDIALLVLALALTALTTVVVAAPGYPAILNDRFDVTILTAATLTSISVAALAWERGRVGRDAAAVLRGSAFAVLALGNGLALIAAILGADAALGATLDDPGQIPLFAGVLGRGISAALLIMAGTMALTERRALDQPVLVLIGPAALLFFLLTLAVAAPERIPTLAPQPALDALVADPTAPLPAGSAPALVVAQSAIGIAFLVAAGLAHRSFRRTGRAGDALLAAGLLIAAYSQVNSAINPGSYAGIVTTGDLLRLAFYCVLLVGIVADSRDDLADLRAANSEVRRLADAEVAAVALEERARLAREIHDGLAQDLWYAKLKQSRLAQIADLDAESRQLSDEISEALDSGLAEARHAVAAMRGDLASGPLLALLARQVEDFSDRFALRAELDVNGAEPELGPREQAEVVRIVQEALTNVRKHADATVVRIVVDTAAGDLKVTITDNGRGFRPDAVPGGFGLDSMRQRASVIGGELEISSMARGGSRVQLVLPLARGAAADAG